VSHAQQHQHQQLSSLHSAASGLGLNGSSSHVSQTGAAATADENGFDSCSSSSSSGDGRQQGVLQGSSSGFFSIRDGRPGRTGTSPDPTALKMPPSRRRNIPRSHLLGRN